MQSAHADADLDHTMIALADQTRRRILTRVAGGETRVTDIAAAFPISLNSVSKLIRLLERALCLSAESKDGSTSSIFGSSRFIRRRIGSRRRSASGPTGWRRSTRYSWLGMQPEHQARSREMSGTVKARVSHRFKTSAERVFDAWLDPEMARRWMQQPFPGMGPMDVKRVEIDPRVGGPVPLRPGIRSRLRRPPER